MILNTVNFFKKKLVEFLSIQELKNGPISWMLVSDGR